MVPKMLPEAWKYRSKNETKKYHEQSLILAPEMDQKGTVFRGPFPGFGSFFVGSGSRRPLVEFWTRHGTILGAHIRPWDENEAVLGANIRPRLGFSELFEHPN